MIIFQELTLKNFLSYGNNVTTINLENPGTTLIIGEDLDNTSNGKGGNGCGKSSILNALVYALYDKPISDISKDNLVNNINKKNMLVTLKFIDDNGVHYEVRRERGTKSGASGNNVYLFINGEDKTPDSLAATNTKIEQIIGIPYELFVRIVVFSASHTPFLDIKTEQQKEIIEELFGLTMISLKAELLKLEIKDTKMRISMKSVKLDSLRGEHERHNQQLGNAQVRVLTWDTEHQAELDQMKEFNPVPTMDYNTAINVLKQEVQQLSEAMKQETETKRAETNEQITGFRSAVKRYTDILRTKLKEAVDILKTQERVDTELLVSENEKLNAHVIDKAAEVSAKNQTKQTALSNKKQLEADLLKLEADLVHLQNAECPYCLQAYEDAVSQIGEIENKIAKNEAYIPILNQTITACDQDMDALQSANTKIKTEVSVNKSEIDKIRAACNVSVKTAEAINMNRIDIAERDMENEIRFSTEQLAKNVQLIANQYEDVIVEKADTIDGYIQVSQEFERSLIRYNTLRSALNPYASVFLELNAIILEPVDYTDLNALTKELEHQEFLLKLLTKKDSFVRKALLNKNVPLLNARLRYYLTHLGLPHRVEFTKEMSATISQFGRTLDFGNLSAGQRARVNFALSLAFRDVLQNLHPKINICLLDEILDTALDSVGVQAAAKIIKQKAREEGLSMYVISHRDEIDSVFNNKMVIQMKDGFSIVKPTNGENHVQ